MSNLLTCPAPIEMCRPGAPMRVVRDYPDPDPYNEDEGAMLDGIGQRVIFLGDYDEADHRATDPRVMRVVDFADGEVDPIPLEALEIDLSDETGEQHAVSWCAEQVGLPRRGARLEAGDVAGDWVLRVGSRLFWFQAAPVDDGLSGISRHVPGLAGIPNTDEGRIRAVAVVVEHLVANPQEQP